MQRQLVLQFHLNFAASQNGQPAAGLDHDEILNGLAKAAKRIALSAAQIRQLPGTYAAALSAQGAVTEYAPADPAPFLPKDLLTENGPWIGLRLTAQGGRQGVVANFHFSILCGSTSFEVRMRHPEGRAAGMAYLKSLADMAEPFLKEGTPETARLSATEFPNPATPQFPAGTAWAHDCCGKHPPLTALLIF
ncbi:MAG: hypothetical protein JWM59_518 [Verrucomicrobiales bacterium]|nr:hypothetical protein [Verrucomicrobiales bacterium]